MPLCALHPDWQALEQLQERREAAVHALDEYRGEVEQAEQDMQAVREEGAVLEKQASVVCVCVCVSLSLVRARSLSSLSLSFPFCARARALSLSASGTCNCSKSAVKGADGLCGPLSCATVRQGRGESDQCKQ